MDGKQIQNEILLKRHAVSVLRCSVKLRTHHVLHEADTPITHGYFLNSGLASFLSVMKDGKTVEVGLAGKEGFVGLPLTAGLSTSSTRVVAQVAGTAFKIKAFDLARSLRQCPQLQVQLNRFAQAMMMQATQVAACNRVHEIEQRMARWLLMSQDRPGGDRVPLTQEFLAHMLGTRRASVTVAAGMLQRTGLIKYTRGEVNVVNRTELENVSCECYQLMMRQSKRWERESER